MSKSTQNVSNSRVEPELSSLKNLYIYPNKKGKQARIIKISGSDSISDAKELASKKMKFTVTRLFDPTNGKEYTGDDELQRIPDLGSVQISAGEDFIPHLLTFKGYYRDVDIPTPPEPEPVCEVIDDTRYVVQEFLDKQWCSIEKQYKYLVRWRNYPPEFDSWEPEDNLKQSCQHLIDAFEQNHMDQNNNTKKQDDNITLKCQLQDLTIIIRKDYEPVEHEPVYCKCRTSRVGFMVQCEGCEEWFHGDCVGFDEFALNTEEDYLCEQCKFGEN